MKVLVVDDNSIIRLGLERTLETIEEVAEVRMASDGVEALEVARGFAPDVVLLDVRMPRMGGLEALPVLAERARVVMLTNAHDAETIHAAMAGGASGYLVHGSLGREQIAGALATCRQGGMVLGPEASAQLALRSVSAAPGRHPLAERLTEREALVVEAAAEGMSNEEIAREHFLSPRTVKNYLNSAYPKLGVHTRAEAVIAWREAAASPRAS